MIKAEDILHIKRAYHEGYEAARAEFGHKAAQYDDVVKALQVADGGKYRADTIEALLHRLEQASELAAHVERLFEGMKIGVAQRALLNRARAFREKQNES